MPLDAPAESVSTASGITKTHVKSSKKEVRLGLVTIIAVNEAVEPYLRSFSAYSLCNNNSNRPQKYSFVQKQFGPCLLSLHQEHGCAQG